MKVRFLEDSTFEGMAYLEGEVYDLAKDKVSALGSSVVVVEQAPEEPTANEATTKEVRHAPRTTAMKAAPTSKEAEKRTT